VTEELDKETPPKPYVSKTDREIHELALGMLAGTIFTDRHVKNAHDLVSVFMPLGFMSSDSIKKMLESLGPNPLIYQHTSKAAPMALNGNPCFWSFAVLSTEDTKRLFDKMEELRPPEENHDAP